MIPVDHFTEAFADLRANGVTINSEVWTEADTRSKFIDTLLQKCLGWKESDFHRELEKNDERLDYLLSTSVASMVVEAKRTTIDLPVSKQKGLRRVKIEKLIAANPSLEKPIEQVAGYCHRWSAPIAVLTNGSTYIIFLGSRVDKVEWRKGDAVVLPDLFAPDYDFSQVQDLLSRDAVASGKTTTYLAKERQLITPLSVIDTYQNSKLPIANNEIGNYLEPLLKAVFSDVSREDSPDVLENCYVPPKDAAPKDPDFIALQVDKPPWYLATPANVNSLNSYRKFQDNIKEQLGRKNWAGQTLLIVGGVGAGKTFFLRRYFTVIPADDPERRDTVGFYVDYIKPEQDPSK